MLALLLLQVAAPQTAADAERAFERTAQEKGQWTAFREFAADDATMFVPQPVNAQAWLKERKDPPVSVKWQPADSFVSCDGAMAVNTGPWVRPNGVGYFTTVWRRENDGHWKWSLDHGDTLGAPRSTPERGRVRRASCDGTIREWAHAPCRPDVKCGHGLSADRTLHWDWQVEPDGARSFSADLWNGQAYDPVVRDEVAAPKQ